MIPLFPMVVNCKFQLFGWGRSNIFRTGGLKISITLISVDLKFHDPSLPCEREPVSPHQNTAGSSSLGVVDRQTASSAAPMSWSINVKQETTHSSEPIAAKRAWWLSVGANLAGRRSSSPYRHVMRPRPISSLVKPEEVPRLQQLLEALVHFPLWFSAVVFGDSWNRRCGLSVWSRKRLLFLSYAFIPDERRGILCHLKA